RSVLAAASASLGRDGVSAGASRTTSGTHGEHASLEAELALFLGTEACAILPDGALADLAAVRAAVRAIGTESLRCAIDADAHPALVDAFLACSLEATSFAGAAPSESSTLILTDGVYPMDGRAADLDALLGALPADEGLLLVDDSHGLGVLGDSGRGIGEGRVEPRLLLTGSLSKALGCGGGYVAGSARLVELARRSTAYVGTTPIPPAVAAGCRAALRDLCTEPCQRLRRMRSRADELAAISIRLGAAPSSFRFPVRSIPVATREEGERLQQRLVECGLFVPFVHYPGSPAEGAFRLAVNADHSSADLDRLEEIWTREAKGATSWIRSSLSSTPSSSNGSLHSSARRFT
ncbi:MAG: aminotransferase class I/II-fold pyridoxal phosphate-dependent enzyme, partial [Planctomycetota bacterium]